LEPGSDSLRELGEHQVTVRLDADHHADVTVIIEPEDEELMDLMVDAEEDDEDEAGKKRPNLKPMQRKRPLPETTAARLDQSLGLVQSTL
jgi:hypothetical protein